MAFEDALHGLLGRYMAAPQWLRSAAGGVYRRLPAALKYGARFEDFHGDAERGAGQVPAPLVEARLEATLQAALSSVPAYAAYRDLAGDRRNPYLRLAELPLVSKLEIKSDLSRYVSTLTPPARRLRMFTGGSTAHPMLFYLERAVTRPRETAYSRAIDRHLLGAQADDWTLSLRGRTVGSAQARQPRLWLVEPIKRHLIFSSDHLEARFMPRYTEPLRQLRPRLIHAFPSALYPMCRWLVDHPCPEFSDNVAGVLLTSENVYDFQIALFRRVFRGPIILHYGLSERVLLATSAADSSDYVFWPLYGHAELVAPNGQTINEPGVVGEIVGTGFDNAAMPFVRYRTGDLGAWKQPGGHGQPQVMQRIDGRLQEFVVCRDERLVSVTTLGAAHFSDLAVVDAIQFEQREAGEVILRFVARRDLAPTEVTAIQAAVESKTQGGCRVVLQRVDRIDRTARGKQRMLLQHIPLERYLGAAVLPGAEVAPLGP